MIISAKQVMQLLLIAIDSLFISGPLGLNRDDRYTLVDAILNQQSDKLIELEKLVEKKEKP